MYEENRVLGTRIREWIARRPTAAARAGARFIEPLEERMLLASPHVTAVVADDRGMATLTFDAALMPASVNGKSVMLYAGSKRVAADIAYRAGTRVLTVTARDMDPDTHYRIRLLGSRLKGTDGKKLDGEFNGVGKKSGNGVAGGDFLVQASMKAKPVARFSTISGAIDVNLYSEQMPMTYRSFRYYANRGDWDGTFFHRSLASFILQGGGYRLWGNSIQPIPSLTPVPDEAKPGKPGNIRGTIAMANVDGEPGTATNQWFFNLGDNRSTLDKAGSAYAVFGKIANAKGMKVLARLAAMGVYDATSLVGDTFSKLPVRNKAAVEKRNPPALHTTDLVAINRVAMVMDIGPVASAAARRR